MTDEEKVQKLQAKYVAHLHGMQAGVTLDIVHDPKNLEAKHLRVGINSSLVDSGALAFVLVKKGLITELELWEELASFAEREHHSYEEKYSKIFGKEVKLG